MIGAALMTRPADALRSAALRAYSLGQPFDHRRVESFEALATRLASVQPAPFPLFDEDEPRRNLLPFYEAYFSNFIEGTEFGIEQAAAIVFDNDIPADRPRDAHDILGTYQIVGDPAEMAVTPSTPHELIQLLQARHRTMLAARPDVRPGLFKERTNQAGSTLFVDPALVEPTLRQGFEVGQTLLGPFARAVYLMFLVSEVHPFDDGNGRIARIMMNAELERAREGRIIIPTVFRNEYLSALKGATHNRNFDSLIDVLSYAQRYAARIDFSSRLNAERDLSKTNAFRDSTEAERTGIRLRLLPPFGQELGPLPLPESVSPR